LFNLRRSSPKKATYSPYYQSVITQIVLRKKLSFFVFLEKNHRFLEKMLFYHCFMEKITLLK